MTKVRRISVNAFETVMNDTYEPSVVINWHDVSVTVFKTLSFTDVISFVNCVANSCFTDKGVYTPEAKDFAIKTCVLEKYANFTMPKNITLQYDLLYRTDAVETVLDFVNVAQFHEIVTAIDDKIEYMLQTRIGDIEKQMTDLYTSLSGLQEKMSDVFSGVSSGDMNKLVSAMSAGGIDEEKLVKAYINNTQNENGD